MSKKIFKIIFLNSKESFDDIEYWLKYLKEKTSSDVKVFLIGNKSDLEESRLITKEQGLQFKKDSLFWVTGGVGFIGSNLCEAILRLRGEKLGAWMT